MSDNIFNFRGQAEDSTPQQSDPTPVYNYKVYLDDGSVLETFGMASMMGELLMIVRDAPNGKVDVFDMFNISKLIRVETVGVRAPAGKFDA